MQECRAWLCERPSHIHSVPGTMQAFPSPALSRGRAELAETALLLELSYMCKGYSLGAIIALVVFVPTCFFKGPSCKSRPRPDMNDMTVQNLKSY